MRKTIKKIITFVSLALATIGIYWFIIHPNSYSYDTAVRNGDVVMGAGGLANVNNKIPDKIKITQYGDEGMYLIENISYDGKVIKAVFDSTMAFFKSERKKEVKKFNEIQKVKESIDETNISAFRYYLINQNEKIEIFIAPEEHK